VLESARTIKARVAPLLLLAGAILAGWLALDAIAFRSGAYYRVVADPASTAGATMHALRLAQAQYVPGARNVLVLGDSRVNEGFSSRRANAAVKGINFVGVGVAGSTPRVWRYLLRRLDPHGDKYAAIVMVGIVDEGWASSEALSDRDLDLAYLQPLVGVRDVVALPASFDDPAQRARAQRAVLLPLLSARADLGAFLATPATRLHALTSDAKAFVGSYLAYPGNGGTLAGVAIDPNTLAPTGAPGNGTLGAYLAQLREARTAPRALSATNANYFRLWFWRIADQARAGGARVFIATLPRGPYHARFGGPPRPSLQAIGLDPGIGVSLLASPEVYALEQPEYYFDGLHLNAEGRVRYSDLLAREVAAALAPGAPTGAAAP
jgi:hypothetical protein